MNAKDLPPPPPGVDKSPVEGVKRINNKPMLIIGGVVLAFAGVIAVVAAQRAEQQKRAGTLEVADESLVKTESPAGVLVGFDMEAGMVVPAESAALGQTTAVLPDAAGMAQAPAIKVLSDADADQPPAPPVDPFDEAMRQRRLQQLQTALASGTSVMRGAVEVAAPAQERRRAGGGGASAIVDPRQAAADSMQSFQAQLATQMQNARAASGGGYSPQNEAAVLAAAREQAAAATQRVGGGLGGGAQQIHAQGDLQGFQGESKRWKLDSGLEDSKRNMLRAGAIIPGVMISGINSDLPGQVTAQVAQAVYDTETGRQLLIPQGTRLIGAYESKIVYAQRRLFVAWQRLVFPDGRALDIGAMGGTDTSGYSGFKDKVDNHYLRTFGSALLMSGIVAGINLGDKPRSIDEVPALSDEMRRQLAVQIGNVATKQLEKNLNVSPTLEIRPGYRFNIMVTKDLQLDDKYAVP